MKSIQWLKYSLLIVHVNALAHPGHQEFIDQASTHGIANYLVMSLVGLAALAQLMVYLRRVQQRKN